MNDAMSRLRGYRAGPVVALGALLLSGAAIGCGGDDNSPNNPTGDTGVDTGGDTSVADAHGDTADTNPTDGDTSVPDSTADTQGDTTGEIGPQGTGTLGTATKVTIGAVSGGGTLSTLFDAAPDGSGANVFVTGYAGAAPGVFQSLRHRGR